MSTTVVPSPSRCPRRPALRAARVRRAAAVVAVLALAGCGLRLETPDPTEPTPDAAEQVRAATVDDALALADAAATVPGADEATTAVLAQIQDAATTHVTQLGGVYDSGLPAPTDGPTTTDTPTVAPATATAQEVVDLLVRGAVTAAEDALHAEDAGTARLLSAVSASRALSAVRLAAAVGVELGSDPVADAAAAEADTDADANATAEPTQPAATADAVTLSADAVIALVTAEDQAGFGMEVAAARLSGDDRERAVAAAAQHRERAEEWAQRGAVVGTERDPRQVAYALPADLSDAAAVRTFCAGLEQALAVAHADTVLVSATGSDDRATAVARQRTSALSALTWGGTPTALPGMDTLVSGGAATDDEGATDATS